MTSDQQWAVVMSMFPNWREHLSDGKIIDQIVDAIAFGKRDASLCIKCGKDKPYDQYISCFDCRLKMRGWSRTRHKRSYIKLTPEQRHEQAQKAAKKRWANHPVASIECRCRYCSKQVIPGTKWCEACKTRICETQKRWRMKHKEQYNAYQRERHKRRKSLLVNN